MSKSNLTEFTAYQARVLLDKREISSVELTKAFFGNQLDSMDEIIKQYLDAFGSQNVFIELQKHFVKGDVQRNGKLIELANKFNLLAVATNNVHYHLPERRKIQDILI